MVAAWLGLLVAVADAQAPADRPDADPDAELVHSLVEDLPPVADHPPDRPRISGPWAVSFRGYVSPGLVGQQLHPVVEVSVEWAPLLSLRSPGEDVGFVLGLVVHGAHHERVVTYGTLRHEDAGCDVGRTTMVTTAARVGVAAPFFDFDVAVGPVFEALSWIDARCDDTAAGLGPVDPGLGWRIYTTIGLAFDRARHVQVRLLADMAATEPHDLLGDLAVGIGVRL